MAQQEISSNEVFGISRKLNNELDGLPIHAHGVIVEMLKNAFEYRNIGMKKAFQDQQVAQQERVLALREAELAKSQADKIQPHLVNAGTEPPPN